MTENKETWWNFPGLGLGIFLVLMVLFKSQFKTDKPTVGKDFVAGGKEIIAGFDTISDAETDSLIGLSTSELRQRLGKPNNVKFPTKYSLEPRTPATTKVKSDEIWVYFNKVKHKASGTTMSLSCDIRDGKCIAAKIY
jgi:hypothetical protein